MPLNSFVSCTTLGTSESVNALIDAPLMSESRPSDEKDEKADKPASEEPSPVQQIPCAASTQLLSLMHRLEENGVQLTLGDMDVVSSDISPPSDVSTTSKRKRIPSDTSKHQKKKSASNYQPIAESHNHSINIPITLSPIMLERKVVEQNATQPKNFTPFPDKVKVVDTSKMIERPLNITTVHGGENVRTHSKRDESSKQNITPKQMARVNAEDSGAAGQVKEAAAGATHRVSTQGTTNSSASDKQQLPLTCKTVSHQTKSPNAVLLQPHRTCVRSVFICGSCAFTASEDGTVHVYDLKTNSLVMRILGHSKPVTWLYVISLTTSSEVLKTIQLTTEYLNHLTLITGCEDENIRQFSLESCSLLNKRCCNCTLTCVVGHRGLSKLYVGTLEGLILTYNPSNSIIQITKFKANGEILCLKIITIHGKRAIIMAARRMDPVVYDMETEDALFTLTSNIPSNSFYSISNTSHFVFCCDANKNLFTFDLNKDETDNMYQNEILPYASVNSYLYGKRFLILACMDGVLRVLIDITQTQRPYTIYDLPGQSSGQCLKTITCMTVVADKIVCGSISGKLAYYRIPNLEALCKVNKSNY